MPFKIRLLFFTLTILSTASCSYNPLSRDNHLTGKPVGAAIGTTAGAGTAALIKASEASIGLMGLGGAAVGYYVTTLDFISGGIKQAGGDVFTQGDCVTINLPTGSLFEENTATLRPEAPPALASTVTVLNDYPDNDITISGNSSGYDTRTFEKHLAQQRAKEVSAYLWAHNVTPFKASDTKRRKITVMGYGYAFPIANSITADGIYANSHIQISACPAATDIKSDIKNEMANIGRMPSDLPRTDPITQAHFEGDNLPLTAETTPTFQLPIFDKETTVDTQDLKHEKASTNKEVTILN